MLLTVFRYAFRNCVEDRMKGHDGPCPSVPTTASNRESICLTQRASILARNITAVLLTPFRSGAMNIAGGNSGALLTVARQPVICTRFLIKGGFHRLPRCGKNE